MSGTRLSKLNVIWSFLPQLRRYMIFGDRLTVLTDSQEVLLFQAESSR